MTDLRLYQVTFVGGEFSPKLIAFPKDMEATTIFNRILDHFAGKKIQSISLAADAVLLCGSVVDFE